MPSAAKRATALERTLAELRDLIEPAGAFEILAARKNIRVLTTGASGARTGLTEVKAYNRGGVVVPPSGSSNLIRAPSGPLKKK